MNKEELLKMNQEELTKKIKELLEIHQVDLILKYLYQEQRINETIEYIENEAITENLHTDHTFITINKDDLLDILKGEK